MPSNKAIIPLYLNSDMLNNLFTIVIQEFVEIKSISTKDVLNIHLKTPVSELSYDLFGKYMQGELEIHLQNEFTKQRTEERISTTIVILKKLKDILQTQGILKSMYNSGMEKSIEINDYVEFPCMLIRNPYIENLMNAINILEVQGTMDNKANEITADSSVDYAGITSVIKRKELLDYLKTSLSDHKQERCIRYIAHSTTGDLSAVVPIKMGSLLDHEDYMLSGKVTILGKVVKTIEEGSNNDLSQEDYDEHLISNDAFFDYLDFERLNRLTCPYLRRVPQTRKRKLEGNKRPKFEILPIAIYI